MQVPIVTLQPRNREISMNCRKRKECARTITEQPHAVRTCSALVAWACLAAHAGLVGLGKVGKLHARNLASPPVSLAVTADQGDFVDSITYPWGCAPLEVPALTDSDKKNDVNGIEVGSLDYLNSLI